MKMRRVAWGLFVLYVAAVLWLTLIDRTSETRRCMLVPLWEWRELFSGARTGYWLGQIGGNLGDAVTAGRFPAVSVPMVSETMAGDLRGSVVFRVH